MILIYKGSKEYVTEDFTHAELFSNSPDIGGTVHKFDERVIYALQAIRSHYKTKIRVLSTFRTQTHNTTIGGKPSSLHLYYRAIDWQFFGTGSKDAMKNFQNDIQSRGEVFQILRKMGIAGFGLYKNFNHIDSRNESVVPVFNNKDEYGWYSYFDYR